MIDASPWKTIWLSPRDTISRIVAQDPNRSIWVLSAIYGFSSVLNAFQSLMLGFNLSLPAIFLLAIVLCPFWGYVSFSIFSYAISFTGKWLKGSGTFQEVRAAYAWSCVPLIVNIPLWFVLAAIFGPHLFTNFSDSALLSNGQVSMLFSIFLIRIGAGVWSIVIYLNALAQVQKFSVLRAIGNLLLAGVIIAAAAYILLVLFFGTVGGRV